jgi:hypothetical protein
MSPLPSARSAYGWMETAAPQIISGEFDSGGLLVGRTARIGVHGTSAADTTFRFAGLDMTSSLRPGTPIVLPDVVGASTIDITRMANGVSHNAPGPVVGWQPLDGSNRIALIEGFFMPSRFKIKPSTASAPPAAELHSLADGSIVLAGALSPRSNAALSAHWARASRLNREFRAGRLPATQPDPPLIETTEFSAMGHFTFMPNPDDRATLTFVVQRSRASTPTHSTEIIGGVVTDTIVGRANADPDSRGTVQGGWQRRLKSGLAVSGAVGYQWMHVGPRSPATLLSMDSALDGAVFPRLFQPHGKENVGRANLEIAKTGTAGGMTHRFKVGGGFDRASIHPQLAQQGSLYESVNGRFARVWRTLVPETQPRWTVSTLSGFAQDRVGSDYIWLEAGVRYDKLGGDNGGETKISWANVFPHVAAEVSDKGTGVGVFGSFTRAGARLPAMALAYGDVNAPSAYAQPTFGAGPQVIVITRVGPGAAGGVTKIAPELRRPVYDLAMAGLKIDKPRFAASVSAVIRKTKDMVRAVGDQTNNYTAVTQLDKNADFTDSSDDQQLTAYNRRVETFGNDTYTLTNPTNVGENSIYALDITAQYRGKRARLAFSAAAVAAKGTAASRGFRADENDPMIIGDALANPNATVNAADGRTFFDRGYIGKIMAAVDLPFGFKLGVVTRYEDGQPFSRLAIFENLNQGPEAVMAYRNGRPTRFTYISTTDVRLQKNVMFGSKQLTLIADGFNVFNIGREVGEYVIGDAQFRTTSLIEPPRTVRVGVRIAF